MEMTLGNILLINANRYPMKEAVAFEDARATFTQLDKQANKRAHALLNLGVKKGDHVATLSSNAMELVESVFGIWRIGAVVVPLNIRLSPNEISYIVDHSDASTILFQDGFEEVIREITPNIKKVERFLGSGRNLSQDFIDFEELTARQPVEPPRLRVREEDVATIVYTAGTTGKPKGVVATHRNWLWEVVNNLFATWGFSSWAPKVLSANPFFHVGGYINLFWSIFNGGSIFILKLFDPREMLQRIEKEKIERVQGPSTIYKMLLQVPEIEEYDLSSVRVVGSGAESMPHETRNRVKKIFPNAGIWEFYGMTEVGGVLTVRSEAFTESKPYSVGPVQIFEELRIVDEDGRDVPVGQVGEIIVRGPNVMKGYYKDPERTAEAIRDGWFYTQDLGRWDEDGFLYVIERKHNMIISGGENIYPKEVEDALFRHPRIADAAVFGAPDDLWGQRVCAAIVLKKGEEMTGDEVKEFCKQELAGYKKPRSVFFLDALPRSSIGKVLRSQLKEQFKDR